MEPIKQIQGGVSVLMRDDIDTDQIIPARYMKRVERTGFGEYLFADIKEKAGFDVPPNPILVTGVNFGCGSSREHAPWALDDYGFKVIIAKSFADIFRGNAPKTGLLPVELAEDEVEFVAAQDDAVVDLESQEVRAGGRTFSFEFPAESKRRLLNGLDDIGVTLDSEEKISAYEAERERKGPDTLTFA
ncbi:MAG TPA: 3-isopropylmalate dehydratase small subunit [Thermoleophilaceae bacterium]|nr:3-isopropylmalate dehydratase small subunit [Thermoleophilaceae bacterium]